MPKDINRINKLQSFLQKKGPHTGRANLDALLISSVPQIIYLTNYPGFSPLERDCYLLITKKRAYLFTSPLYLHELSFLSKIFSLQEMSHQSLNKQLAEICQKEKITNVGVETDNLTVTEYKRFKTVFKILKDLNLQDLRVNKTSFEIKKIQKACKIGDDAFNSIQKIIKPGISEQELAFQLELFIRQKKAELAFPTIVAFGKNSAIPHHKTDQTKLKSRDVILLDFGVKIDNYCSDMTRTFFIGNPTKEQKIVYETVLSAQKKAIEQLQNRKKRVLKAADLDKASRDFILSQGFPSIPHALGHGIGIEVHESPQLSPGSKDILTDGMVFSLEPGIYLPARLVEAPAKRAGRQGLPGKFGVRIEDLFTLKQGVLKKLTRSPQALTVL